MLLRADILTLRVHQCPTALAQPARSATDTQCIQGKRSPSRALFYSCSHGENRLHSHPWPMVHSHTK
jgi:hypothetical protein